jgi:hypothetical protein
MRSPKLNRRMTLVVAMLAFGCGTDADDDAMLNGPGDPAIVDASLSPDAASAVDAGAGADGFVADDGRFQCPAPEPCDPVDGVGCDEPDACLVQAEGPVCTALADGVSSGDSCEGFGECEEGLGCFATREGGSVCDRLCCGDDDCGRGERCGAGLVADGASMLYGRCLPADAPCDVLDPIETCEPGEACYVVTLTGGEACQPAGHRDVDEPCAEQRDCAPGLACRGLTSTCKRLCVLETEDDACPALEGECVFQPQLPPGVGLCRLEDLLAEAR